MPTYTYFSVVSTLVVSFLSFFFSYGSWFCDIYLCLFPHLVFIFLYNIECPLCSCFFLVVSFSRTSLCFCYLSTCVCVSTLVFFIPRYIEFRSFPFSRFFSFLDFWKLFLFFFNYFRIDMC